MPTPLLAALPWLLTAAIAVVAVLSVRRYRREALRFANQTIARLNAIHDRQLADALTRANRAEAACEELRLQVMRGASVAKIDRKTKNSRAARRVCVVAIEGKYHVFTPSVLPKACTLYGHLVSTKQIQPLPIIRK
jgi:hypothetical protein